MRGKDPFKQRATLQQSTILDLLFWAQIWVPIVPLFLAKIWTQTVPGMKYCNNFYLELASIKFTANNLDKSLLETKQSSIQDLSMGAVK